MSLMLPSTFAILTMLLFQRKSKTDEEKKLLEKRLNYFYIKIKDKMEYYQHEQTEETEYSNIGEFEKRMKIAVVFPAASFLQKLFYIHLIHLYLLSSFCEYMKKCYFFFLSLSLLNAAVLVVLLNSFLFSTFFETLLFQISNKRMSDNFATVLLPSGVISNTRL